MRIRSLLPLVSLALVVAPAFARFSDEKPKQPNPTTSGSTPQDAEKRPAREQAETWYHDAYEDVTRAKELSAGEKADLKKAKKHWERSIERAARALEYDARYHEALNLQGFAWRHLKDYEKSLAAYAACLALAPDYAPAREYYGQALLESGNRKGAEEQLAYLRKLNAEDLAKSLEAALAATPASAEDKAKAEKAKAAEKADPPAGGGH
jgi:tetratricopeptide (TPR) repeat protein